ncbi:hypothetical protein NLJ89_g4815 [Agrocybe chaxingu]|uniref:Cytochrome P450 n=1 Tax=Agrocybe chaxingu TaxID=84603 RepID=A0A9W8MW68_9AGAR|nr:hypothetical protein NLJ89_g4815 [Agrocybe chaxingu]
MSLNATFKSFILPEAFSAEALGNFNVSKSASTLCLTLVVLYIYRLFLPSPKGSIKQLGGFPVTTAWTFFSKRTDFILGHFKASAAPHFRFQVLQHQVVALRGEEARKAFFDSKSLNFTEGYKILFGAAPRLQDITINTHNDVSWFNKHILTLLGKRRLTEMLPSLLEDVNVRMIGWGKKGCFDPFKNIYDVRISLKAALESQLTVLQLVFQMTVRMASCSELAEDRTTLDELQKLYWQLEKSSTPTALLLPWFPGPAKKRKRTATKELFTKIYDVAEARRKAAVPSSDAVDVLLGQGQSTTEVVEFIIGAIFAGIVSTGIISCWALVYLASDEEWMAKAKAEVNALIDKHTNTLSTESLSRRLATIPISAWEDEMPVMEAVIRETLRVTLTNTLLRRNVIDELSVSNGTIQQGDFVVYNVADVYLNSEIYTNPREFDPGRYDPGREEDKKSTFGFKRPRKGRHPCTGMKVAKLEIKVIVTMMLAGFDFDIVDKNGKHITKIPVPDRNDIHQARPVGDQCFFEFERIVD